MTRSEQAKAEQILSRRDHILHKTDYILLSTTFNISQHVYYKTSGGVTTAEAEPAAFQWQCWSYLKPAECPQINAGT